MWKNGDEYGKRIMGLLNPEVELLSQDAERLRGIMSGLVGKMDMGRARQHDKQ